MKRRWYLWMALSLAPCGLGEVWAADVERVALLAWHDRGWKGKPGDQPLRYAGRDARLLAKVLKRKGHYRVVVLARPTARRLSAALKKLVARSAKGRAKKMHFLFYYSGHADEKYLRLGPGSQAKGRRFPLERLAGFFKQLRASVKIGILDACNSGALIDLLHARTKGRGRGHAPFFKMPSALSQGMAILTSASTQGKARELDRLSASLFTYHLVQGLWGKADQNRDGKVTSLEAYRYARLKIEQELPGRQQPMFLNHFRGQEDYPITLSYNASLVLPVKRGQRYTLLGRQSVWKFKGIDDHPRVVSLMAGAYTIFVQDAKKRCFVQAVKVAKDARRWVSSRGWKRASCKAGTAKGKVAQVPEDAQVISRLNVGTRGQLSVGFHAGPLNASPFRPWLGAAVGLALGQLRLGLTFLGEQRDQLFASLTELSLGWGWQWQQYRWQLHLGFLAGVGLLSTQHASSELRGLSPSIRYGGHLEFCLRLSLRWWWVARGFFGLAHTVVRADAKGGTFLNALAGYGSLGIGYRF